MEIRTYLPSDETELFELLCEEGEEWSCYYSKTTKSKYINALESSISYVILENDSICGFIRCRDDSGFGIYILDLLVRKQCRGRKFGRYLIETICNQYPNDTVYVTSDADTYYKKLGCQREGTVFEVILK